METSTITKEDLAERLSAELKTIALGAEELLKVRGSDLADKTEEIRDQLAGALDVAQETLDALESKAAAGIKAADRAIRARPYQAVGLALGAGVLLGLFLKRK